MSCSGNCGFNGENCLLVETTLVNPTCAGCGSSTDLSLIAPHAFSVTTGFGYYNGCDGAGANCDNANCNTAFHQPSDTQVQVQCETNNVSTVATSDTPCLMSLVSGFAWDISGQFGYHIL